MESILYPKSYYDARNNFEADIATTKSQFEVSYSIFYGQYTKSVALEIASDLPEQVKFKILESLRRHFRLFYIPS